MKLKNNFPIAVWGFLLWLVGYILGFVFFFVVPPGSIGWLIMPIGIIMTLWVLFKKVKPTSWQKALAISVVWTLIAIVMDYFGIIRLLHPADGYYRLDVYLYYAFTFVLPLLAYWKSSRH